MKVKFNHSDHSKGDIILIPENDEERKLLEDEGIQDLFERGCDAYYCDCRDISVEDPEK